MNRVWRVLCTPSPGPERAPLSAARMRCRGDRRRLVLFHCRRCRGWPECSGVALWPTVERARSISRNSKRQRSRSRDPRPAGIQSLTRVSDKGLTGTTHCSALSERIRAFRADRRSPDLCGLSAERQAVAQAAGELGENIAVIAAGEKWTTAACARHWKICLARARSWTA